MQNMMDATKIVPKAWRNNQPLKGHKFTVCWSDEYDEYVGTCPSKQNLSHRGSSPGAALYGIMDLVLDLAEEGPRKQANCA